MNTGFRVGLQPACLDDSFSSYQRVCATPLLISSCPAPCRAKKIATKIPGKGGLRWYKNVGLGFKTPKEAIEGV